MFLLKKKKSALHVRSVVYVKEGRQLRSVTKCHFILKRIHFSKQQDLKETILLFCFCFVSLELIEMEPKQIKAMFFILTMIMALVCHHQSEAMPYIGRLKCIVSLRSVEGCMEAIEKATKGDNHGLDKECCDAIRGLANDCLPIIFSGGPAIGLVVQAACSRILDDVN